MFEKNKIERDFIERGKATQRNGIVLLSKFDAIDFIKQCEEYSISILGIDGFHLRGETIQPSLDNSIDFSSRSHGSNIDIYKESVAFITDRRTELFYEVICK